MGEERTPTTLRRWPLVAGAVLLVAVTALVIRQWPSSAPPTKATDVNKIVDTKVSTAIADLQALPPASVTVYNAIHPAMVIIQASGVTGATGVASTARKSLGSG